MRDRVRRPSKPGRVCGRFRRVSVSLWGTWGHLTSAGRNVIRGLINGITGMMNNVGSTMSNIASTIRSFAVLAAEAMSGAVPRGVRREDQKPW